MSNILVVAEHLEGKLRKATLPTIGFAKKAQALTGGKIIGLVLGHNAASVAAELATAGVDKVVHVDSAIYANYLAEAYAPAVAEIAKVVEREFTKRGVAIKLATKVVKLEVKPDSVVVHLEKGGVTETIEVEQVLVAVGFLANTENLGLDKAGVKLDDRGFIQVDDDQQTTAAGVYAIGDVAGKQLLAHKASFEGEAAVAHIAGHHQNVNYAQIPGCTYCQPQVASVGLTEKKAKELGKAIKIGKFQFVASGKAKAQWFPVRS